MTTDQSPLLYARGFAFAGVPMPELEDLEHFTSYQLPDGHLYADVAVPVSVHVRDDRWAALVGLAIPISDGIIASEDANIARSLLQLSSVDGSQEIERALYDLGGRYALLLKDAAGITVYHDATGTRSVYIDVETKAVSSHLDVLERHRGDSTPSEPTARTQKIALLWHTTRHPKIRALLANQKALLGTGETRRYHLTGPNPAKAMSSEQRLQLIERAWGEQLTWVESLARPLAISLTGGMDSRFTLAMAASHKDRYTSVTYTTQKALDGEAPTSPWEESMALDHEIVRKLSPFLPTDHHFLPRGETDPWLSENRSILDRNSEIAHGRWILPLYRSQFPDRRSLHYRGNLLEIGRLVFAEPDRLDDPVGRLLALIRKTAGKDSGAADRAAELSESAMVDLGYPAISPDYELTDVWYWEVRHARWYAQVLAETDVVFESFTPFNVRRVIDAFLAFPPEMRKEAFAQNELTYRANPFLMFLDINGLSDLYRRHVSGGTG